MSVVEAQQREVEAAVVAALEAPGRRARFVTEVLFLASRRGISAASVEEALRDLEERGRVLVRDHYAADPHLAGVDLRVAGLVQSVPGIDGLGQAVADIEAIWQEWLRAFLAEHRCC